MASVVVVEGSDGSLGVLGVLGVDGVVPPPVLVSVLELEASELVAEVLEVPDVGVEVVPQPVEVSGPVVIASGSVVPTAVRTAIVWRPGAIWAGRVAVICSVGEAGNDETMPAAFPDDSQVTSGSG
jgi:hypothetical protein